MSVDVPMRRIQRMVRLVELSPRRKVKGTSLKREIHSRTRAKTEAGGKERSAHVAKKEVDTMGSPGYFAGTGMEARSRKMWVRGGTEIELVWAEGRI